MVGGAPGLGGGPTQPPSIKESEAQAFVEVTKKYVMAMVYDSMAEVIPFTQREYDEVFKYRAESDRPTPRCADHCCGQPSRTDWISRC